MAIVRMYLTDVASSWYGRPATDAEVDAALRDEPADDLAAPSGAFFLAELDGEVVGCAGVRFVDGDGELTKVFTVAAARGSGVATMLVQSAEDAARRHGAATVRLDTRSDLVAAWTLYERLGYARVEPYGESAYSDRWYRRVL